MYGESTGLLFVRSWTGGRAINVPLVKSGHYEGTDNIDALVPEGYFEDVEIRRRWMDFRVAEVMRKSYGRVWPPSLAAGAIIPACA